LRKANMALTRPTSPFTSDEDVQGTGQKLSPLEQEGSDLQAGLGSAQTNLATLNKSRAGLISQPGTQQITRPGSISIEYSNPIPGFNTALSTLDNRIADAQKQVDSFTPRLADWQKRSGAAANQSSANTQLQSVGAAPLPAPTPAASTSTTTSGAPAIPRPTPVITPTTPAIPAAAPAAAPVTQTDVPGVLRTVDKNGNPVYSDSPFGLNRALAAANGDIGTGGARTGAVPASAVTQPIPTAAAAMPIAGVVNQPNVQFQPAITGTGPVGVAIGIPGEDQRQAAIRASDYRQAMAGADMRSKRDAITQVYLQGEGNRAALQRQQLGDASQADRQAAQIAAETARANAQGNLTAQQINAGTATAAADRASRMAEERLRSRISQPIITQSGAMGLLGDNNVLQPIVDPTGRPVMAPQAPRATGALTQADLLRSYDTRRSAVINGIGDEATKQKLLAEIEADPLYAPLRGGTGTSSSSQAPAGMTLVGTKGGKNVYRDANGNLQIEQ
jgi:hypothetical protein